MLTPSLKTHRFTIRAFTAADLELFTHYRSQPEVAKYQSWSDFNYADALSLFEKMDYQNFGVVGAWYQLAIADCESDILLGDLAVHFIDDEQVEIGFTIAPANQQKHVAKEAAVALLGYLFNTLNKHRVVATTDAQNVASYRLLESLGFRREAHFRQNIFFKGAWGDEYQYAMLRTEQATA
ncbi:GNAT family N-acetyltransferase [Ferrimonas lipolytica]|uniref:GNAT family N-acetyltransferase n=1 Tax=Ferrimonas lipolytica TaxID=2724191 RepID=A0A6H1UER4_9GAMM|nr:GNAT family protein [Ferrimonas lipolytica]QIZ77534.1 GNAT family N-acetyltransferase [Ferrimonas lipolytica]